MTAGQRTGDLSAINHDPKHTKPRCDATGCRGVRPAHWGTKAQSLRTARAHAALTGHTVTIDIWHWQRVRPKEHA